MWLFHPRSSLDRGKNSGVITSAAEIAVHCVVDLSVRGLRRLLEQSRRLHDLARLAISTLRDVVLFPSDLQGMGRVRAEPFDGGYLLSSDCAYWGDAASDCFAVEMDCARAAQSHAATELRPGQLQLVA